MSEFDTDEFKEVLLIELDERIQEINDEIQQLEKDPTKKETYTDLLRTLHSVKGLFSLAGYGNISTIAHHLETLTEQTEYTKNPTLTRLLTEFSDNLDNFSKALKGGKTPNLLQFDQFTQQIVSLDEFVIKLGTNYQVKVFFKPKSKVASARSLVLISKLKQKATITSYSPPYDEIQAGIDFQNLTLEVTTQEDEDSIREICEKTQDVFSVQITRLLDSVSARRAGLLGKIHETLNVRVNLDDLDQIIRLLGDLVVYGQFIREIGEFQDYSRSFRENLSNFERTIANIQDLVIRMRLVPLETILNRFPRMVREISQKEKKEVEFIISGKHIGVDRSIIEQLISPLTHLLRNSVSHGIEKPKDRKKQGKDPRGLVNLTISHERSDIVIEVKDDGRGIDYEKIAKKARELKLVDKNEELTRDQIHNILLSSDLSTIEKTTELSGRGVGLTTIKKTLDHIGGNIEIVSELGQFTSFKLIIPLSVAITKVLLLTVKEHQFALPMDNILQILSVPQEKFRVDKKANSKSLIINEEQIPVVDLRDRFVFNELNNIPDKISEKNTDIVILWNKGTRSLGFIVDELLGERDVVIKPIHNFLAQIGAFSSATVLEGGQVVLIIDPMNFLEVSMNV